MAQTIIARGSSLAIRKQGAMLSVDAPAASYWDKFEGVGEATDKPVLVLTELEKDQGDTIDYNTVAENTAAPTEGDDPHSGREEALVMSMNELKIDALTHGVDCGRKMTRKRTRHDLQDIARRREGPYWGRVNDEMSFMYASGERGDNAKWLFPLGYTGFAGNTITAPDAAHIRRAGGKAYASIGTGDTVTLAELNTVKSIVDMLGSEDDGSAVMLPTAAGSKPAHVYLMSIYSENNLKNETGTNGWMDMQKAIAANLGEKSGICTGALGYVNGMLLHSHQKVIRFSAGKVFTSGTCAVALSRNLVLGRQALCKAYGTKANKGVRYGWTETYEDRGRKLVIDTDTVVGWRKNSNNAMDTGILVHDVAATAPVNA